MGGGSAPAAVWSWGAPGSACADNTAGKLEANDIPLGAGLAAQAPEAVQALAPAAAAAQQQQLAAQQQPPGGPHFHFRLSYATRVRPAGRGSWWLGVLLKGAVSAAAVAACVCKRDQRTLLMAYVAGTVAGAGLTLPGTTLLMAHLLGAL
jgi:hypothetical protein